MKFSPGQLAAIAEAMAFSDQTASWLPSERAMDLFTQTHERGLGQEAACAACDPEDLRRDLVALLGGRQRRSIALADLRRESFNVGSHYAAASGHKALIMDDDGQVEYRAPTYGEGNFTPAEIREGLEAIAHRTDLAMAVLGTRDQEREAA